MLSVLCSLFVCQNFRCTCKCSEISLSKYNLYYTRMAHFSSCFCFITSRKRAILIAYRICWLSFQKRRIKMKYLWYDFLMCFSHQTFLTTSNILNNTMGYHVFGIWAFRVEHLRIFHIYSHSSEVNRFTYGIVVTI